MNRLGDWVEITSGFPFPSAQFSSAGEGQFLVRGDNVGHGDLRKGEGRSYWWEAEVDERYALKANDVVVAMDRPWISSGLKFAVVREDFLPALLVQRVARLRAGPGSEQRFLAYVVRDQRFAKYLQSVQTGTGIPHVSAAQIANYPVEMPDLATQTAIADVLGALDDKIVANERALGATLALARLQFADTSRKAESEWLTYDDVVDVQGGGTPRTGTLEYWGGPIRWATPTDVTALTAPVLFETSRTITEAGLSACSSQLHEPGSILMTSRATIGAFAWAFRPVAVNQGFIVAKAKNPMAQLWLFFEMQSRVDDYLAHANGATFLELSRSTFKRLPVAWPSDTSVFDGFNRAAQPLLELTAALVQENERLAATRDALLPELMSGRLTIRTLEDSVR